MKRNRLAVPVFSTLILAASSAYGHTAPGRSEPCPASATVAPQQVSLNTNRSSQACTAEHAKKLKQAPIASTVPLLKKNGMLGVHRTRALVVAVDKRGGTVTLSHAPVKSLKWPAMTMKFLIVEDALYSKFQIGKTVDVSFKKLESTYVVIAVD